VSVTALSFGPSIGPLSTSWILALGAETGDINYWDVGSSNATILISTASAHCHGSTVKKLEWTPDSVSRPFLAQESDSVSDGDKGDVWRIGSCGEDHTVRIFQITQ
jgi:hypothetical protein